MVTTILAAILGNLKVILWSKFRNDFTSEIFQGIILVVSIKPGSKEIKYGVGEGTASSTTTTQDALMDLIR